jgi:hypothetical protein
VPLFSKSGGLSNRKKIKSAEIFGTLDFAILEADY